MAKSPVEKKVEVLRDLWMEHTQEPQLRLLVWRIPNNADRMLQAFFEVQQHPGDWNTADLFVRFDAPFETGFGYSRALRDALVEGYVEGHDSLKEQGVEPDWPYAALPRHYSAAGFMSVLGAFAEHHQAQARQQPDAPQFRYVAAVLDPGSVASQEAWEAWLDAALSSRVSPAVRLVLVDTQQDKRWDGLVRKYGEQVGVIEAPIDMFDIARETAAQAGGAGPAVAYRQLLTDVIALVEKGSAAQTSARADKALKIVQQEQWFDQQVVLHMAVAGAYVKEKNFSEAITRYRSARECGVQAEQNKHPVGADMIMQTWFGEAGVWLAAGQPERAAQAYRSAAEQAQKVPNPMFEIEGFRMAAYCYAQAKQREPAREHGALAVRAAKAVAPAERPLTTLPLALQDLLRLQDASRTEKLERCAADYQAAIATAHKQAEEQAGKLGNQPAAADLQRIEDSMHERFEASFQRQRQERERLIAGGDEFFRKVVALGRDMLDPLWNGLPTVKHPLDKEVQEWSEPPQFTPLPDPTDLLEKPEPAPPAPAHAPSAALSDSLIA
ncbi:tetratricopeptide repeat protein [Paraherbaspirillum soli]|uniref:Tetratricopeptide repeat protein n=1 Tax=Paraherbaspirillum soli TaxID=631222 RepID=A0ABW0MBD0_9BURK